jgi:hypothetical protein
MSKLQKSLLEYSKESSKIITKEAATVAGNEYPFLTLEV